MKEKKVIILIGIPASGKTTWSLEFIKNNPDYVRIGRDAYRLMLRNELFCEPKIEDLISKLLISSVHKALMKNFNVIIDNTNLKQKYITEFIEEFKYDADIDYHVFDISVDNAIERDKLRDNQVGEDVIKRMFNDYQTLCDSFGFQPFKKQKRIPIIPDFHSPLPECVLFDLDGTLALMGNRGPFEWHNVHKDDLNLIVYEQIEHHIRKGRKIIIVSGRDSVCRIETQEWLYMHGIIFDELYMRPEDDFRKDTVVKKEIYNTYIKGKYNVICVYDDRLQVINMWYDQGIFTFNVNQGNHEF